MGGNRPLQILTIEGIVLPNNYCTLGLAYPKHLGSAIRACALGSRSAILHSYLLGILDFSTSSTLHTISLHFLLLNRFQHWPILQQLNIFVQGFDRCNKNGFIPNSAIYLPTYQLFDLVGLTQCSIKPYHNLNLINFKC